MKKNYELEAIKLSKAIDIAIEAFEKFPREVWSTEVIAHTISCYREWKDSALKPKPEFRKLSSLNYITNDVFTLFEESSGKDVEYFWKHIKEQNLGYIRKDQLQEIIIRGKIKNRIEFEYITDIIVTAEQEKTITKSEAEKLSVLIDQFEHRNK